MTEPQVRAAGGVVIDAGPDGTPAVLAVHRPAYDDWSLPKGKVDPGETFEQAAVREVHEETGVTGALGVELTATRYEDRKGRDKLVRWWVMPALDRAPRDPDDEVDERRWVPLDQAVDLLTYDTDRALVREALARRDHASVLLVRHAQAGDRRDWDGDDERRPLSDRGRDQAAALVDLLAPWHVSTVLTSPLVRCAQTVAPLGTARGLTVTAEDRLAEGASRSQVADLLGGVGDGTVLCSHGDVIGALLDGLVADGVAPPDAAWAKGSTWLLELDGDRRPVAARYLRPPA